MGFGFTWRYVWRVLGVISLFAALAGPAWATFPATAIGWQFNSTQGYGCNGKATAAEACACKMTPVGGGGYGNYLVTMIGTKNATCEGRFGLTTYNYQTLISQSDLCPVNSTLGGSSCTCNQGFVELNANSVYSCVPAPFQISFNGATSTKALPAGSALQQTALVTQDGLIAPNKSVSISITGGGSISGVTDSTGQFFFNYLPPANAVVDTITGTCDGCANTATSQITVTSADAPNMCLNEAGTLVGNPIVPATGEKVETQLDWTDAGAHPLSLSRHYKSYGFGSALAGLGTYWSHNFAASISGLATDNGRAVRLGDGTSVLFNRVNDTAPWTSNTAIDTLTSSPVGPVFTRASDESRWQFDALGKLVSVTQRNGWVMALAYTNGYLTSVTNQFGRSLQLAYDVQGRLTSVTTPDAQVLAYGFDAASRHNAVLYPDGKTKTYQYGHYLWPNALTGIVDENANSFASFEYDANGRAISTSHAGNAQKFSLDFGTANASPVGSLQAAPVPANSPLYKGSATVTTPLGGTQTLSFQGGDGNIRLLGSNAVFGGTLFASRGFDYPQAPTLPTLETDFLGTQTQFTWDTARRLQTSITQAANRPENQARSTQWHPSFRLPTQTMEPGRTTAFTYDPATGNKLSETIADTATGQARTWAWSYNAQGLVATSSDARGFVSTYSYDAAGNVTRFKNPLNQETLSTFDAAGRTLTQTQANGLLTTYTYDPRGRMLGMVHSGPGMAAEASTFSYTPSGQVATSTLPNGMAVAYRYDAAQRLVGATDNRGNTVDYLLDGMGNRLREEVKDPSGSIALLTTRVISSLNRVAAVAGAIGQTTQLAYDANGEPIQQTDPLNQTTRQTLDGLRRSTGTTFADNAQASQSWTALNQLAGVTDPKSVQTQYVRNAFGEVMSEASPDMGTLTYQRDAGGNVTHMTDAKGQTTQYTRDELGRATQVSFADGKTHQFNYDSVGNLSQFTDASGSTNYSRDALGRVLQKTQTIADNPSAPSGYSATYQYRSGGKVAQITYPSGLKVYYRQNTAGQTSQIDVQLAGLNKPVVPFVINLAYTALNQPKTWAWNHGPTGTPPLAASRSFDTDGRMASNEFASYGFDAASRITSITQNLWATLDTTDPVTGAVTSSTFTTPLSWNAAYDNRNRLTSFGRNNASSSTSYTYDANSNRLSSNTTTTSDTDQDGDFDAVDFSNKGSRGQRGHGVRSFKIA